MPMTVQRLAQARRILRGLYPAAYLLHLPPEAIVTLADLVHVPEPKGAAAMAHPTLTNPTPS